MAALPPSNVSTLKWATFLPHPVQMHYAHVYTLSYFHALVKHLSIYV